jgi:colanic acid biosynthesis glycosyl transferase WcaI
MICLIVSCVFSPEPVVSARTSTDLAQELAACGHRVRVISAFPNRPAGRLYKGFRRRLCKLDHSADGYDILRVFCFFSSQSSLLSRFLENISFGVASALAVLFLEKPDVIYANTWPIFAQGMLVVVSKLRQIPLVLSIQDLYPESLFVQNRGLPKASRFYKLLRWSDIQIARHCAGLIVISEQFKKTYICDRGVPEHKITIVPNWVDELRKVAYSTGEDIRKQHEIPGDAFLLVYGGNIGTAAGVEQILDAFQYLILQENIYLLIAGSGSSLPVCVEKIQKHKLEHVKIHSPWNLEDTFSVLDAADVCILPTQGEQALASVPSKLLTYMIAARPVLAIASPKSETARIIMRADSGWVLSECDPAALAAHIHVVSRLSSRDLRRHGQAGQSYVTAHFSKTRNLPKVVDLLLQHGKQSEQDSTYATL